MMDRIGTAIFGGAALQGARPARGRLGVPATVAAWRAAYDVAGFLLALTAARFLAAAAGISGGAGAAPAGSWTLPPVSYGQACALAACVLGYLAAHGHYHLRLPLWSEARQVVAAAAFGLLLNGAAEYLRGTGTDRAVVVGTWVLFVPGVLALRSLTMVLLEASDLWRLPVVVVGEPDAARSAAHLLEAERRLGYSVVSQVSLAAVGDGADGVDWRRLLERHGARLVVLAPGASGFASSAGGLGSPTDLAGRRLVDRLRAHGIPVAAMAPARHLPMAGRASTTFVGHDLVLVSYANGPLRALERAAKVGFDVASAALLLLFLMPVMLAIAAAVRLDGGKALYAHPRIGSGGRRFPCLKFRSMVQDSDAVLERLLRSDPAAAAEWAATQKLRNDPRVTRVGRVLRSTSLDELPQLLNVLRLEMSLVGPRPIVDGEVAHYGDEIAYYYQARPGLTGLWQVSGRSDTTYAHRVQLDSWYVRHWSLWQDVAILLKTVPAVLKRQGAV